MCLTIPGKIESIKEGRALVTNGSKKASVDLSLVLDVKVGDWILFATDRAVKVISEADAKEIISLLEEQYHPVDVAKLPLKFKKIIFKVRSGDSNLAKDEILYLLQLKGGDNLETLYAEANFLRKEKIDDFVCIHGIIEFSNYCKNLCLYCGIRNGNNVERYRMSKEEIVQAACEAEKEGYKLLVLQSGEDDDYSDEQLLDIISEIKRKIRVFIFLSIGVRSNEFYKKAFRAGATGSLIRFESSNKEFFERIKPKQSFNERIKSIKDQIEAGYYMATGSLIGLPDQTLEMIADDLLFLQKLNPPMISSGPYLGAKGTPLADGREWGVGSREKETPNSKLQTPSLLELTLKYIAVARFLMPNAKIPITTALETLDKDGRHKGLLAGANALMFNLTPEKYCKNYRIYDNKYREREKVWQKYGLFKGEESFEMLENKLKVDSAKRP